MDENLLEIIKGFRSDMSDLMILRDELRAVNPEKARVISIAITNLETAILYLKEALSK